jgi:antitoxin CptB
MGANDSQTNTSPEKIRRMHWRCRRGMLELDLLLVQFMHLHYNNLTPLQSKAFDLLLEYPDNDLWDLVANETPAESPQVNTALQDILALLRQCN